MKLSEYAKLTGISYQTAWRMWKRGQLNAYQLPTGTITLKMLLLFILFDKTVPDRPLISKNPIAV